MAYTPSDLKIGQASLSKAFAEGEMRYRNPVVLKNLVQANEIAVPTWRGLKTRDDRAFELDFFIRTKRALGNGRSHTHTGAQSGTQIITPSFTTYNDGFFTSLKQADRSTRTLQEELNHELLNTVINFSENQEQIAVDYIFNNRNAFDHGANIEGTFNVANQVFEIDSATNGDRAMQIALSRMDILNYQGVGYDVYCDTISYNKFMFQMAQGQSNDVNTNFQFVAGNMTFYHAPDMNADVQALTYTKGFYIVSPRNTVACLDWIPVQNRNGVNSTEIGGVAEFTTVFNPITGMSHAVHKIWEGFDGTATGGYTQDVKEDIQISIDLAFEKAPLTNATETQLIGFALT